MWDLDTRKGICSGKSDPPPAPDYAGAAQQQGIANKEAAIATSQLSNPNVTNPYGSQTVTYKNDPTTGNPVPYVNQTLSPTSQLRFDQNNRIDTGLGNVAEQGLQYVQGTLDSPFNQSTLPSRTVNAGETGQDAIMRRLEPQMTRRTAGLENQLVNQGLVRGSEAFNAAMDENNRANNDLLSQAAIQGIGIGDNAREKAIQEQEFFRTEPLNILNAVRSAAPVNIPQFQGFSGANVAAAPIMQGASAQGNADMQAYGVGAQQQSQFNSGLMSAAATAAVMI